MDDAIVDSMTSQVPGLAEFDDAEVMSVSLWHTDVQAVQLGKGPYGAKLLQRRVRGWDLQYIAFGDGASSASGSGPVDKYAFVIPLSPGQNCRLLGKEVSDAGIGIYAPGSEHADVSTAGLTEFVLTPPDGFGDRLRDRGERLHLLRSGSEFREVRFRPLTRLREVLQAACATPLNGAVGDNRDDAIADCLERALLSAIVPASQEVSPGRAPLARPAVLERIFAALQEDDAIPRASELAALAGVSYPTLHRTFLEWFGMSPVRYLLLRRMYVARRRLKSGEFFSVSDVATSCGFWELGRFSVRYRQLFGEPPSKHLNKA